MAVRSRTHVYRVLLSVCLVLLAIGTSAAEPRRVLALYKSSEKATAKDNEVRQYAAEPLAAMGYAVDYVDADQGWPSLAEMQPYDAIITWFRGPSMPNADAYAEWLGDNMAQGRRVIVMGNYGAYQDSVTDKGELFTRWLGLEESNNFFSPFGLEFARQWTNDTKILSVALKVSSMVEFQIPLTQKDVNHYFKFNPVSDDIEPFLVLDRKDVSDARSPIIVRTRGGGMALEGYLYHSQAPDWVLKWRLNLADFLKVCLQHQIAVRPTQLLVKAPDADLLQIPPDVQPIHFPHYSDSVLPAGGEFSHTVLGLYKSSEDSDSQDNALHERAEVVLNHLGIKVVHYDINQGLPDDAQMQPYMGVISWFRDDVMEDPEAYAAWAVHQIQLGRKFVILGDAGLRYKKVKLTQTRAEKTLFEALGIRYLDPEVETSVGFGHEPDFKAVHRVSTRMKALRVVHKDASMVEFEKPLTSGDLKDYSRIQSGDPKNKVYLSIIAPKWGRIDPVIITPHGGVADGPFAYADAATQKLRAEMQEEDESYGRWRINPFRFFSEALGLQDTPRLDVTTLNGSRVFYSHIDGDGFPGISLIDHNSLAGQFVYRDVLKVYPLPVTVSVITRDMELRARKYYNRELQAARDVYRLDNIEPASHTQTHPFQWRRGDLFVKTVDPEVTLGLAPTDLARQITYSINFINRYLVPPDKRCEVLLWSGNCQPSAEAIKLVNENGCRNMNGGDPVYDTESPTYSGLCALTAQVGDQVQYYTSGRGEFLYTDGWTKNFGAFAKLRDHFDHTEKPRRIMPLNIYFHHYVGDRQEGIESLKANFDYCMKAHCAPLFASQYIDSVSDWLTARLYRKDDGWVVVNSGNCRTVRFDIPDRWVDMARSKGVLGCDHVNGSLYVHLDDGVTHEIYLSGEAPATGTPWLLNASHYVDDWKPAANGAAFTTRGMGPAHFTLAGLHPNGHYVCHIEPLDGGKSVLDASAAANARGEVNFETLLRGYHRKFRVTVEGN